MLFVRHVNKDKIFVIGNSNNKSLNWVENMKKATLQSRKVQKKLTVSSEKSTS